MKRQSLLIIAVLFLTANAFGQLKSVTDYYLAMPADLYSTDIEGNKVTGKAALAKHRRSLIKIEDFKNGYLRLEGPWEGWAEIAIFKKKDGSYLVGHAESGCGPACSGFVKFYTVNGATWTEVTDSVFTPPTADEMTAMFKAKGVDLTDGEPEVYYLLPRVGTTVSMACNMCMETEEPDFKLMSFAWDGMKFTAVK